jgi:hypothetical protein
MFTIIYLHAGEPHRHTTYRSLTAAQYHLKLMRRAHFVAWIEQARSAPTDSAAIGSNSAAIGHKAR